MAFESLDDRQAIFALVSIVATFLFFLLWLASVDPETLVILLVFAGIAWGPRFVNRFLGSKGHRGPERQATRWFQFSIGRLMVFSAAVGAFCEFARVLDSRLAPLDDGSGHNRNFPGVTPAYIVAALLLLALACMIYLVAELVRKLSARGLIRLQGVIMFGLSKKERWAKIQSQPFPPEWSWIMARNVPIYARLSELDKAELRGLIQVFLAEKVFEGCGGLEITDEIKVTIASQACLLLLRRDTEVYPRLITILVYPSAYVSNMPQHGPHGLVTEGPQGRLGEAWTSGVVVLSWDDVKQGATDVRDGHNVVFHEFAHQLDQEDGSSDGAPILPRRNLYSAWARVLGEEYQELRKAAETGKKSVLDTYGATEPAEFFAVATEAFFEKPVQLKKKHPELYEELKIYYNQDPEADFGAVTTTRPKL
jgi:Mlc titration factor MtfA (ptsG expression regulator)